MRIGILLGTAALLLTASTGVAAEPEALRPYAFLIGEWPSSGSGQPGTGSGTAIFTRSLQDRVITRTSYAEYPSQDGKPASRHDDLMIIYATAAGARADYYDSEGHVIRYAVSAPAPGEAVFVSKPADGQPAFRLSYRLEADGTLNGVFEVAPPGAPDAFKPYLTWRSHKAGK